MQRNHDSELSFIHKRRLATRFGMLGIAVGFACLVVAAKGEPFGIIWLCAPAMFLGFVTGFASALLGIHLMCVLSGKLGNTTARLLSILAASVSAAVVVSLGFLVSEGESTFQFAAATAAITGVIATVFITFSALTTRTHEMD